MSKKERLKVTKESGTGLNKMFKDTKTGRTMTRGKTADAIEAGKYPGYHVMKKDNKRIPRSNPGTNNLG
ncbi:hypothetical protein RYX56_05465 [Alkalihalophilus lindianensis]|uniref:Uncharacterized protein n=1 Tax=Alkalihalophilus lindianensis TaxID=1630542 RepID=A0ABU3X783_9BACI|nr:hypothetical protein [Alkalihalophilus lindianensis]MDV2683756.1 hypothetical protein [Alkalihalophilus lindianensis]MDV2683822.1 hypothetical protein [Alkalihalophilus lindianensis]